MYGIQSVFSREAPDVELSFEYLDTKRHATDEIFPLLEELYKKKLHSRYQYDAVIVSDNNALGFILDRRELILPNVPIVFCGINNFNKSMFDNHTDITGVAEAIDLKSTIELALELHPGTKNIVIISGSTKTASINLDRFRQIKPYFKDNLTFIELVNLTADELKKALQGLPQDVIILTLSFYRDREGRAFSTKESLDFIVSNSTIPVYSAWDHVVASGALGGVVVSGRSQGENAAKMALQILNGKSAEDIPIIEESPNVSMFNYVQMHRFNLTRKNLPLESIILNEPKTFSYKYGKYIWLILLFISFQTLVILVLLENTRRRRIAEHGLIESEERFRGTFEQAAVGIAHVATDGRWLRVNQKLCKIVGYTRDELLDLTFQDITHPNDLARDLRYLEKMLAGEAETYSTEKRYIRKDQSHVWINLTVSPVKDSSTGSYKYFISITEDISSRREAEEMLHKTHQQLLHVEKLSSIGRLSASIAHEFNNPLYGVMNVLGGIQKRAILEEVDMQLVGMALKECDRMKDLIQSLQDFNRPTSGRAAPVDVHKTINSILLLGKKDFKVKKITIEKDYAADMPLVIVVADQLKQVILNLLNNAFDAFESDGTIKISTKVRDKTIRISVQDNGKGIEPENLSRIFEPFFTTKPEVKGTGLGLSVSYGIIRKHGGTIEVESTPGEGSNFTVILPFKEAKAEEKIDFAV